MAVVSICWVIALNNLLDWLKVTSFLISTLETYICLLMPRGSRCIIAVLGYPLSCTLFYESNTFNVPGLFSPPQANPQPLLQLSFYFSCLMSCHSQLSCEQFILLHKRFINLIIFCALNLFLFSFSATSFCIRHDVVLTIVPWLNNLEFHSVSLSWRKCHMCSLDAVLELEPMNSYNRLLVHRLAEIFG